jgi:DNA-binding LacI/PurR family transcriptional regulator
VPEEFVYYGESSIPNVARQEETISAALSRMCRAAEPPTAIMTNFDPLAELIYLKLIGMGLRMPEDISLMGIGGTWREGAIVRRLTSVTVNETEIGRRAAELLHEMQVNKRPLNDDTRIVMSPSLSPGETLGPAPTVVQPLAKRA